MATLYITEYATALVVFGGNLCQVALEPPLAEQTVAIGGSSTSSAAFNANTTLVRLSTDAICSLLFGTAPTALATSGRLPADNIEYHGVPQGKSYKVAVITNS